MVSNVEKNKFLISRIERLQDLMRKNQIKHLILKDNITLRYLLGFRIESVFNLLIHSDISKDSNSKQYGDLIVPDLEFEKAKFEIGEMPFNVIKFGNMEQFKEVSRDLYNKYFKDLMSDISNDNNDQISKIGFAFDYLTLTDFNEIYQKFLMGDSDNSNSQTETNTSNAEDENATNFSLLDSKKFYNASKLFDEMREIKYPDEIEKIQRAAVIADNAMEKGIAALKDGVKESEIAAIIEFEMKKQGAIGKSFDLIVASGNNSWFPHAGATEREIKDGEIVTMDIGALYEGYCSDLTRTVLVGKGPYNEKLTDIINIVNESQKKALEVIKPGIKCQDVDAAARNYFKEKGVDQYFIHGLGHGVGLEVHDKVPRLAPNVDYELKEGMIVTVEPGIYIPGTGGARTEDLILVTKDGYKKLSNSKIIYY